MSKEQVSKKVLVKGITAGVAGLALVGVLSQVEKNPEAYVGANFGGNSVSAPSDAKPSGISFTPGTYTSSAQGAMSEVSVSMACDDTMITALDIDASAETPELGGAAAEQIAGEILSSQGVEFDAVSGATLTSEAIRTAVKDCITQASGVTFEEETEAATEAGTESTQTGESAADASTEEGTYTAEAQGLQSAVKVTMKINNGEISDVQIDASGETPELGGAAAETLAQEIMDAQSADVEAVSGATLTSNAVTTAAQDCIDQATGAGEDTAEEAGTEAEAETEAEEAETEAEETTEEEVVEAEAAGYGAGTYTAYTRGENGTVKVTMTFSEDAVLDIHASSVNGASITSEGMEAAAENCIYQAEVSYVPVEETEEETEAVAEEETEAAEEETEAAEEETEAAEEETEAAEEETEATEEETEATEEGTEEAAQAGFVAGTYTATAKGNNGPVKVSITVDEKSITNVTIDASGETPELGGTAAETLAAEIMEAQSEDVDAVTGATVTSSAVKAATENVLYQAALHYEPAEATEEETEAAEEETEVVEEETEAAEEETEAAEETTEVVEEETEFVTASFVPGSYSTWAKGMESSIKVTVTVDENAITAVSIDASGETPELGGAAAETLTDLILDAQGVDGVDAVGGATVTSNAVFEAVQSCLFMAASK